MKHHHQNQGKEDIDLAGPKAPPQQNEKQSQNIGRSDIDEQKISKIMRKFSKLDFEQPEPNSHKHYSQDNSAKNILFRIEKQLTTQIFKSTYVLLSNAYTPLFVYHLILLLEAIQMLFYVFEKVPIVNEFKITTSQYQAVTEEYFDPQINQIVITPVISYIDQYFKFANFNLYLFDTSISTGSFLTLYFIFIAIFLVLNLVLVTFPKKLYNESRSEEGNVHGTVPNFFINLVSLVLIIMLNVMFLPMVSTLLQGYRCDGEIQSNNQIFTVLQNNSGDYNQESLKLLINCDSLFHNLFIVISTISLLWYLIFVIFMLPLISSKCIGKGQQPWSGFDNGQLELIKAMIKLILACLFIIDNDYKSQGLLVCLILGAYILYKRLSDWKKFNTGVHQMTVFYEVLLVSFFCCVSFHKLLQASMTFSTIIFIISFSIIASIYSVMKQTQYYEKVRIETYSNMLKLTIDSHKWERNMFELIFRAQRNDQEDQIILHAVIAEHLELCEDKLCTCTKLAESLNFLKKFWKSKISHLENIAIVQRALATPVEQYATQLESLPILKTDGSVKYSNGFVSKDQSTQGIIIEGEIPNLIKNSPKQNQKKLNNQEKLSSFAQSSMKSNPIIQAMIYDQFSKAKQEEIEEEDQKYFDDKWQQRQFFKFIAIYINSAIRKFPEKTKGSLGLKILSSYIQQDKLNNRYKAIFDLLSCEKEPSISYHDKFQIFKKKIEIEQSSILEHKKLTSRETIILDVEQIFKYEQLFNQFQKYEYLAVISANNFWKELLQKNFNATTLKTQGIEISRNYRFVVDISSQLQSIYKEDIKFQFRFGLFNLCIMNNEFDGMECFRKAQNSFNVRFYKGGQQQMDDKTKDQLSMYGENTSSAIIIIGANAKSIGHIIHVNDETGYLLGYSKSDLIDRNVRIIIPNCIGMYHEHFLTRYLDSSRQKIIENSLQLFAVTKEGFLLPINIIVKVLPQLYGQIVFLGFIQKLDVYSKMENPKPELEGYEYNYIITNGETLEISNITEGLSKETGIHPKFLKQQQKDLQQSNIIFESKLKLSSLISCLNEKQEGMEDWLDHEGGVVTLDTSDILKHFDIESLSQEDLLESRANQGQFRIFLQRSKIEFDSQKQTLHSFVFRVILLSICTSSNEQSGEPNILNPYSLEIKTGQDSQGIMTNQNCEDYGTHANQKQIMQSKQSLFDDGTRIFGNQDQVSVNNEINRFSMGPSKGTASQSSMSSVANNATSLMRDFKKNLSMSETPKTLLILNRLIMVIVLGTILITIIEFAVLIADINDLKGVTNHFLESQKRNLAIVQLSSNVRSFINLANGIEFDQNGIQILNRFEDRFEYVGRIVQKQAESLQDIHEYLSQQRVESDAGKNILQSSFEYEPVQLYRITEQNHISRYELPFRVGLYNYLNGIFAINQTEKEQLIIPMGLIGANPITNQNEEFEQTNIMEKNAFFLATNGLRSLRTKCSEATQFQIDNSFGNMENNPFFIIMFVGLIITCISISLVLFKIWQIEHIQGEIFALYAHLTSENIHDLFDKSCQYMDQLNEGSFTNEFEQRTSSNNVTDLQIMDDDICDQSQLSEEEKEEQIHCQIINKRRRNKSELIMGKRHNKSSHKNTGGMYQAMIKRTFVEFKIIEQREENNRNIRIQNLKKEALKLMKVDSMKNKKLDISIGNESRKNQKKLLKNLGIRKQLKNKEEESNDQSQMDIEIEDDGEKKKRKNKKPENLKALTMQELKTIQVQDELKEKKQQFRKTLSIQNVTRKLSVLIVALIFSAYFIQTYLSHINFEPQITLLQESLPHFFDRYRLLILTYSLLRERIVFNNSLSSFEEDSVFKHEIDSLYYENSMENERFLENLKQQSPRILSNLITHLKVTDSPQFCQDIIGEQQAQIDTRNVSVVINSLDKSLLFQNQIHTVIRANRAASLGDLQALIFLLSKQVDMSQGDYDLMTPLHFAALKNQQAIVQYLLDEAKVPPNLIDRWGATALNYVTDESLQSYMIDKGCIQGNQQYINHTALNTVGEDLLTDEDLRVFYAVYYGEIAQVLYLQSLGYKMTHKNQFQRTPLHIAASEGHIQVVQYLVQIGADVTFTDIRGNDPVSDAHRSENLHIHEYLDSIISNNIIKQHCSEFGNGLFKQGLSGAIGLFQKKFADLRLRIPQEKVYSKLLDLLGGTNSTVFENTPISSNNVLQVYFSAQEIYFPRIIEQIFTKIDETYATEFGDYCLLTYVAFGFFLTVQLTILIIMRGKMINQMKEDILENRGILNLIPIYIIEENKQAMEAIIRKLKS